jgi:catechol-2,3-dioxygenase
MVFASIRVITNDVTRLAGFYAEITGLPPLSQRPVRRAITTAGTLAIAVMAY